MPPFFWLYAISHSIWRPTIPQLPQCEHYTHLFCCFFSSPWGRSRKPMPSRCLFLALLFLCDKGFRMLQLKLFEKSVPTLGICWLNKKKRQIERQRECICFQFSDWSHFQDLCFLSSKMKMLSIVNPHVDLNLYDFVSSLEHKRTISKSCAGWSFPCI